MTGLSGADDRTNPPDYPPDLPDWPAAGATVVPRPGPLWEGPAFEFAVTQMRLVLMGTGALTLDQIDRHAPGLTRAVVGAYLAAIDTGAAFVRPYIDRHPAPAPNGTESDQTDGPAQ